MLNNIAIIVTTIATVILAVLTGIYVWLTKAMVKAMQATQEPFVDVTFEIDRGGIYFVVMNTGRSSARKVQFTVEADSKAIQPRGVTAGTASPQSVGIANLYPIVNGLSYIPAEQRLKYQAGRWVRDFDQFDDTAVRVTVTYQNDAGRIFKRAVEIDLRQLLHVLYESFRDPSLAVADAITESSRRQPSPTTPQYRHAQYEGRYDKTCSYCCERINRGAKKCPRCHEWLTNDKRLNSVQRPAGAPASEAPPEVKSLVTEAPVNQSPLQPDHFPDGSDDAPVHQDPSTQKEGPPDEDGPLVLV